MAGLILPARFTRQPQYPAKVIDEFAGGHVWLPQWRRNLAINGGPATSFGTVPTAGAHGICAEYSGTTTDNPGQNFYPNSGSFTALAFVQVASGSTGVQGCCFYESSVSTENGYGGAGSGAFSERHFGVDTLSGVAWGFTNERGADTDSATSLRLNGGTVTADPTVLIVTYNAANEFTALWANGIRVASGTRPVNGSVYPATFRRYANTGSGSVVRYWRGKLFMFASTPRVLSDSMVRALSANPWQVFKAPTRRLWVGFSAGSADVTVALTGVSATASAGTLAPSNSLAVTGNAATSNTGTIAPAASIALTGNASSSATGTLAPSASIGLTGNAATGAVGTVTPSVGVTVALTGVESSSSAGNVAPATSIGLTGNAGTGAVGTVTPNVGVTVALTGVSAGGGAGTVSPAASVAVTGSAASSGLGSVVPGTSRAVSGNAATGALASLAPSVVIGLAGNAGTSGVGTINIAGSSFAAITGVEAAGAVGTVTARVDALLGPRPGGPRPTGNARRESTTAARPSATSRTRSSNR